MYGIVLYINFTIKLVFFFVKKICDKDIPYIGNNSGISKHVKFIFIWVKTLDVIKETRTNIYKK